MSPQIDPVLRPIKVSELKLRSLVWLCKEDPETRSMGMATMYVLDIGYSHVEFGSSVTGSHFYATRCGVDREEVTDSTNARLRLFEYREWE